MDVVQYAKLWVWKVTWDVMLWACDMAYSEYSTVHNAMGMRHDLEAMLWFAMLWAQDTANVFLSYQNPTSRGQDGRSNLDSWGSSKMAK